MHSSAAETLALKGLAFLAAEGETIDRFLEVSGIRPDDLRERADDPLVLAAVLDFLLADDKLLLAFAEGEGVDPKVVHAARRALPGAAPDL
jgi:Protein of unknown function (DUF3572)